MVNYRLKRGALCNQQELTVLSFYIVAGDWSEAKD